MRSIKIFVTYSHRDAGHLDRILTYLKGLERDGIVFWTDREIAHGDLWDAEIKKRLAESDAALVLVSQAFLDSDYCTDVEIRSLLASAKTLLPIILSPCEWQRHDWLASRQFLPGGDETIEEHYAEGAVSRTTTWPGFGPSAMSIRIAKS